MSVSFYGGSSAYNNNVRKLEATTFRLLVESYFFIPVIKNFSREAYHAASPDEQKKLKDCSYICCCDFKTDSTRCDANAEQVNLVVVDLDEGGEDFFESPESIGEALYPYSFLCWKSASHTPEKPRLKIMVEVKPCDKQWHRALARHVISRLGLDPNFKGSIESTVLSQPQYRPIQFQGEEFEAVLASRLDGIALSCADLPTEDADEVGRRFAWEGSIASDLGYLPVPDLTVEDVREAVMALDADCNYKQWSEVAASLRHQFRDEDEAHAAFDLFLEWSEQGDKFKGYDATYAKWMNFRPDTIGKTPRTIRSLFYEAMAAGWDNRKVTLSFKQSFLLWLQGCTDEDRLIEDGCTRIAAMPFTDDLVEDFLKQSLLNHIKKVTNIKPAKKALDDNIDRIRAKKRAEKADNEPPNWLRPFCFVSTTNKFRNASNGVEMVPESFDHTYSQHLMDKADEEDKNHARPAVLPRHYALNQIRIRRVDGVIYDPRNGGDEPFFSYKGRNYLNTYLPSSLPEEDAENSEAAGALFMGHLEKLIEEEEYRLHVLHFLCHVVQKPGIKIRWAPLIQSGQGAGKGFLKSIMQAVLGAGNVKEVNSEVIKEKWNDWMVGSVLSILNEIHIPGQQREVVANALKTFISDNEIPVMAKHLPTATETPNLTNAIAFTNYHDAMHMSPSDRRWMAIESPLQTAEEIRELRESGHFERLEPLKGKWGGALRHWMLNVKIPDSFSPHDTAPDTIYRQSVVEESKNRLHARIEELVCGDDALIGPDVVHLARLTEMTDHLARNNHPPTRYLKMMNYHPYEGGKLFDIGGPTAVWVHRKRYDSDFGLAETLLRERMEVAL